MNLTILQGNTLELLPTLSAESVDLCITSPPYWGLRNYGAGASELGAEPTMEAYLDNTMLWVKEVWRVLKPTGSFVLNIGDCFIGGGRGADYPSATSIMPRQNAANQGAPSWSDLKKAGTRDWKANSTPTSVNPKLGGIYKTKQLLSVSSFAYCRIVSETDFVCRGEHIWAKPNVPSPIRSRLKHSHEKLFWFVKDADKYYFDSKAWMKKVCEASNSRYNYSQHLSAGLKNIITSKTSGLEHEGGNTHLIDKDTIEHSWRIVPVGAKQSGFELEGKQASEHIAPYPENLIRPYIQSLAAPEVCGICGYPPHKERIKIGEKEHEVEFVRDDGEEKGYWNSVSSRAKYFEGEEVFARNSKHYAIEEIEEERWVNCKCWKAPQPSVVLDCFLGSGTTMRVAMEEGRDTIGCELNEKSIIYAKKRLNWGQGLNINYKEKKED